MADQSGLELERVSERLFVARSQGVQVARCSVAGGDGVWEIYSTVVDPAHEGRGIASRLVGFVLDAAEESGVRVIPSCWFVDGWMQRHSPRYDHLRHGARVPEVAAEDPACRIAPTVLPGH